MKTLKLRFHNDPGHAWLSVPRKLLPADVLSKISSHSYQRGASVYLEEDCDAGVALKYLRSQGHSVDIQETHTNKHSPIRSYEYFHATKPPRRALKVNDVVVLAGIEYQIHASAGPYQGFEVRRLADGAMLRMPARFAVRATLKQ